jgi:membrane associated rhomboid family serine protease
MLNSLERKFGWLAIPGLPLYIVSAQGLVYVWGLMNPELVHYLQLDPWAVMESREYWRLLTFLFVTPVQNAFFQFFFLYLLYVYGTALEEMMGDFAFTLFYLTGALGTIVAAFFFGGDGGSFFVNTSLFLAFAALNPNFQLYLFFIVPVKIKWLAAFTWATFVYMLFVSPPAARAAILVSLINYFLFFGKMHWQTIHRFVRRKNFESRYRE